MTSCRDRPMVTLDRLHWHSELTPLFMVMRRATGPLTMTTFFFQAEDGIRDDLVTGVQTCALPISSDCSRPWMALNELFGAHLTTPWTATNARYRQNVIIFVRTLRELGARPMLLISSKPYTAGDARLWWLEAAHYADLVQEVYYSGKVIHRQGAITGSRTMRNRFREAIRTFTDIGIPAKRVGIMLGFQASNRGPLNPIPWFEHVKLQALAAKQVAKETGVGSVWSWGWIARNAAQAVRTRRRLPACTSGPATRGSATAPSPPGPASTPHAPKGRSSSLAARSVRSTMRSSATATSRGSRV